MTKSNRTPPGRLARGRLVSGLQHGLIGALLTFVAGVASAQTVSQIPLSVGVVPGNLLLVPSVEWPTIVSVANLGAYSTANTYVGYFDPNKCYNYSFNDVETERYFFPVGPASTRACSQANAQWSGNYLNWATTQTIDPFRKALTGGYRVRDTETETWLEKARHDGNGGEGVFPNRRIPAGTGRNSALVQGATPVGSWDSLTIRIWQLGNRMRFTRSGALNTATTIVEYNPTVHTTFDASAIYEVSVRVKVCDSRRLEDNCKNYSGNWKPEGLIQQYSERLRYSVFGYLNDSSTTRDGGALRARQKFVGKDKLDPTRGLISNEDNREWNPTTGILVRNPDEDDATATTARVGAERPIQDSGVINYINKFGQMTTALHKSNDPVSELYYAAIRYLKRQGNLREYTDLSGTTDQKFIHADGFPVIDDWDDPMQYRCQKNALLGIGDTNTWYDKNFRFNTVRESEPPLPGTVDSDPTNVVTATQKVATLEGITINTPFNLARQSSAFIAGLAYDAHTRDLRSDLTGMQTASTYWVDVREGGTLQGRANNQYWLAAKYGGFNVPRGYDPDAETPIAIEESAWASSDRLPVTNDLRPRNFYVASAPDQMVQSLSRAFARIAGEAAGSGSALASNSTRIEEDTQTYQAQFDSGAWSGELEAFEVEDDGSLAATSRWQATTELNRMTWSTRPIYFHNPDGGPNDQHDEFLWDNLNTDQQAALESAQVVNYLRGDRTLEEGRQNGEFRTRTEILGDIVNSSPVYVGKPNPNLHRAATFRGASAHATFAAAQSNRTPVVYVGANDGMLHGFNASTDEDNDGKETYAFVPNAVIMNDLRSYSDPFYDHRYFVDGEITVADVYDGRNWKTVLVGTLGRGGPGVFALDVTNPTSVQFLWEKNGADIPKLGKNLGRPVIAQVADGDWRVLLGNGPGSTDGTAQLVMIGISSGTVTTVATTDSTGSNALTAVLARDTDGDRFADAAYAGDLHGNLWKFTRLGGSPSASKMFEARDRNDAEQPITAAPLAGRDPETGIVWVFFGTGRYLGGNDPIDLQVQTWYGIKDGGSGTARRSDLVQRDILVEGEINSMGVRVIEEGDAAELETRRGWFMDLAPPSGTAQGERMVVPNRFQGRVLVGATRIPDVSDKCQPSGRGWVMAINPFTGARLDATFFDVTRDGEFTNGDMLMVNGQLTVTSGLGFDSGLGGAPNFVDNVMQVGLDDTSTDAIETQGSGAEAGRLSWRELVN